MNQHQLIDEIIEDIAHCINVAVSEIWYHRNGKDQDSSSNNEFLGKINQKEDGSASTDVDDYVDLLIAELLKRFYPHAQIVSEELHKVEALQQGLTFCIDPLDGTHAFLRREFQKVGSMISVLIDGKLVAAAIGTIFPKKIYICSQYCRPSEAIFTENYPERILRIVELPSEPSNTEMSLLAKPTKKGELSPLAKMILRDSYGSVFDDIDYSAKGSIGVLGMKLYSGNNSGLFLPPTIDTPWDSNPVVMFNKMAGVRTFFIKGDFVEEVVLQPTVTLVPISHEQLLLTRQGATAFLSWLSRKGIPFRTI